MTDEPLAVPADLAERLAERLAGRLGREQVFGPPVSQGDTTLVPVARVRAGAGRRPGKGGGVRVVARPLGAFRVSADARVTWHPAVDVNRIVAGGQLALVVIVTVSVLGARLLQRRAG